VGGWFVFKWMRHSRYILEQEIFQFI